VVRVGAAAPLRRRRSELVHSCTSAPILPRPIQPWWSRYECGAFFRFDRRKIIRFAQLQGLQQQPGVDLQVDRCGNCLSQSPACDDATMPLHERNPPVAETTSQVTSLVHVHDQMVCFPEPIADIPGRDVRPNDATSVHDRAQRHAGDPEWNDFVGVIVNDRIDFRAAS